jgi:hypothetical protein
MALQSSGIISINDIKTELGSASGSLRTLSSLAGFSTPDSMSEFYGFSLATEFQISDVGFPDAEGCCVEGTTSGTQVIYVAESALALNVTVYTNNTLEAALDGADKWWYSDGYSYLINSTGKITEVFAC